VRATGGFLIALALNSSARANHFLTTTFISQWATNNNHETLVRILLDHGAATTTKTAKGRTALDFASHSNAKMTEILNEQVQNTSSSIPDSPAPAWRSSTDFDFYSSGGIDDDAIQAERDFMFKCAMENSTGLEKELDELRSDVDALMTDSDVEADDDHTAFDWEKCLPGQMFVYDPKDLNEVLKVFITNMKPGRSKLQKPIPANVIFLSARYAHYFCNDAMLQELLAATIERIRGVVSVSWYFSPFSELMIVHLC
jgi:hypothetical protein